MKLNTKNVVMGLITPVALLGMLAFNPALAREPYTKLNWQICRSSCLTW